MSNKMGLILILLVISLGLLFQYKQNEAREYTEFAIITANETFLSEQNLFLMPTKEEWSNYISTPSYHIYGDNITIYTYGENVTIIQK